jgi:hypothetical protein
MELNPKDTLCEVDDPYGFKTDAMLTQDALNRFDHLSVPAHTSTSPGVI